VVGNLFLDSIIYLHSDVLIVQDPLFNCHSVPLKSSEILLPENSVKQVICTKNGWVPLEIGI